MLTYEDGMAVETWDHIEVELDDCTCQGTVKKLFPRKGTVRVAYTHPKDFTRNGDPRKLSARVPVADIALMYRDC